MARAGDPLSRTLRGFGGPGELVRIPDDPAIYPSPPPPPPPVPFPEIEYVDAIGGPEVGRGHWTSFAIWTQRRVYGLDSGLVCRAVLDRNSLMPVEGHPVIGLTLAFGQRRDVNGAIVHITRPLPEPGTNAVFYIQERHLHRWSETSPVERVILRQQRVALTSG